MANTTAVTGNVGTDITTSCMGPTIGTTCRAEDVNPGLGAAMDGLATIKSGNCTIGGDKTCTGSWIWNGSGKSCAFNVDTSFTVTASFLGTCTIKLASTASVISHVPMNRVGGTTATLQVSAVSLTTPVVVGMTNSQAQVAGYISDGVQVHYSGSWASGDHDFVIDVTNYSSPLAWQTATQYYSPIDNYTQSITAGQPTAQCMVTSNGFTWVCETSGVSTLAPPASTAIGSTWADTGGAPVWRNIGTDFCASFSLEGSKPTGSGSTAGSDAISVQSQIQLLATSGSTAVPGRTVTRELTRWRPDGVFALDGSNNAIASYGQTPLALWTIDSNGSAVATATAAYLYTAGPPIKTNRQACYWEIGEDDLPQGSQLYNASVYFAPSVGHTGAPANLPGVLIYKADKRTGGALIISGDPTTGGWYWTWTTIAAYEQFNTLTTSVGRLQPYDAGAVPNVRPYEFIDHSRYRYFVKFETESGLNAMSGTVVSHCTVTGVVPFLGQR
ncbi:MAG TPA: hypothetical protein VLT47_14230 [Anaeromyxobacteraceae bacterium]|nr:hypothetical protein [Anaeromyxobacteraceae bacterium]